MADLEQKIRIVADTGAAQDAVGKLADEQRGLAKATDGASQSTKELAKATAQATASQAAARDATMRLKQAESEARAVTDAFGKDSREAAEAVARLKAAEEAAAVAAAKAARAVKETAEAVREAGKDADTKGAAGFRRMSDQLDKAQKDADRTASELRTLEARIKAAGLEANRSGGFFEKFRNGAIMGLGAAAAQAGIGLLGEGVRAAGAFAVGTAANFERLKTALETTTGSSQAAAAAFDQIQKFAARTPFSLEEVTTGFLKLKARGLDPSEKALTAYGDTASAMGKTLDDMVEAVADATTMEFERLKEFGIKASKQGDRVTFTYRGISTTVGATARDVEKYLVDLGRNNFAGGMEKQAQTLGGLFSTLKDTAAQFANELMTSGVADVLKDIMREVTDLAGGSGALAKELGGALASGLRTTWELLKEVAPLFMAAAKAAKWMFDTVRGGLDAMHEQDAAVALFGRSTEVAHDRLKEYARAHGEALGPIGEMVRATFMEEQQVRSLTEAVREGQRAREDAAKTEAMVAALQDRRSREEAARLADLEGRKRSAERSGMMAEYLDLKGDKTLSPSEKKRLAELKKTLDIPDDPKHKRGKKVKDHSREMSLEYGAEAFEKRERFERESAFAGSVRAYEQESEARARRVEAIEREAEALREFSDIERRQVDGVFLLLEVKNAAADRHDELIQRRIDADLRLAQWQVKNAKTEEQREKARTRLEEAENKKRMASLAKTVAAEKREMAHRKQAIDTTVSAVNMLNATMLDGIIAAIEGEKGAIAHALADMLKSTAKKNALLSLEQFALAAGSAAMYDFGGAAAHATAGAMHAGVAAAAGIGAHAAGQVWEANRPPPDAKGGAGGSGGRGGSGFGRPTPSGSDDDGLEAQDVPVSHEQLRRGDPVMRKGGGGGSQVVISGTINMYGAGGREEFIDGIRKGLDRQDRAGKRYRN